MIELREVSKVYRIGQVEVPALAGVSFRIGKGEFVVLAGPSGSGKTTLLRLLYRDELPSEGEIEVAGFAVPRLRRSKIPSLRRRVGMVFQEAKLLPGRTVYDNLAFVLRVLGAPRRDITARVFQALRAVGLSARAHALPAQLSLGEQQRAAVAHALVKNPVLLLADEPTGNLDEEMSRDILGLLLAICRRGTTVLLATNSATLVVQLRRRTLLLEGGRLVKDEG